MTGTGRGGSPKRHKHPRGSAIAAALLAYGAQIRPLPGIQDPAALACLVKQILDSIRRVAFVKHLSNVRHHPDVADPTSDRFDPLKAAVLNVKRGNNDEAVWLTFLAVHFGNHGRDGWRLARMVYGREGEPGLWDWPSVSANPADFRRWLAAHNAMLRGFRFSNHRQYESLDAHSAQGTGAIIESFVDWIKAAGSLQARVRDTHRRVGQNPVDVFDDLYASMDAVRRFGRLGRFDFLTMLGKLGIAPIAPGSAYIAAGATGPYRGMCLLVTGATDGALRRRDADAIYVDLGQALQLGMQELEDALCNWQKSPTRYAYFRG